MSLKISPFDRSFDRENFRCGVEELDRYLKRQISQEIKRNSAAAFILHEKGEPRILGFYTLSAFSIQLVDVPAGLRNKVSRYPRIPATMLGRLAIDKTMQGKKMGELLLVDALKRSWENRAIIGSWAVVVDALGGEAEQFYRHFGFRNIEGAERRLFLTMGEIGKLF